MSMTSLGFVTSTTPGTPVQITSVSTPCHAVNFQPIRASAVSNTGKVYIGTTSNFSKAGNSPPGLIYILSPGQPATSVPSLHALNDDASNYWMDVDTSGDSVLCSYTE